MSTEQSVDPELVEQTKQQIRNLVREIAQLSKSDLAPLEYYDAILNRIVNALAAVGGAIWSVADGRIELEYQINLRETRLAESPEAQNRHGHLLSRVAKTGEGLLVAPHSGAGEEGEGGNPTDFLLVVGPLKSDQETQGIIEIFQRPGNNPNVQRGYLRFLLQMCELAGDYLKTRRLRHFTDRQTLWSQLEQFTRVAHRSLDPRLTAYTIANEGRRLIECDRVSVGILKGKKCVIEAVSGQDTFDKRSNTVSLLSRLATAVTATGEAVWYTGDTTLMAPQVEDAVQAYIDESHSKAVGIIPLKRPVDPTLAPDDKDAEPPEVLGALIVEQIEDSRPREGMMQRVEVVTEHSSTALANALEYHDLFLLPVWQALGKAQWVLKARTLPKTIAIASAVVMLILFLVFWPADFNLEGKGSLEPADRRDVFAALDGVVIDLPVEHGQMVHKGDVLARMRNTDLQVSLADIAGKLSSTTEELFATRRQMQDTKRMNTQEFRQAESKVAELSKTRESYEKQLKLLKEKQQQLVITSPIDGQINTWQLRELLLHRPVRAGQVLMSVADPAGDWEAELRIPEDRMGHVAIARKEIRQDLPVRFFVATSPGEEHVGTVKEVHSTTNAKAEEGSTVLVRVAFEKGQLKVTDLRPGATVTGKINCGRVSVGYKFLHPVFAWFQSKVWFKIF